jgi:hypothetical protein
MGIHIGKKIKEEVYKQRIPITGFARKISRSRNVVYNIFSRESVDTALLNKIGNVLNCDFFSLYSAQKEYTQEGVKIFNFKEPELNYEQNHTSNAIAEQNQALKEEIAYLKKIIALYESKSDTKSQKKTIKTKK